MRPTGRPARIDRAASSTRRPPWHFWLLPLAVAVLRALPYAAARWGTPPRGFQLPPIGYNPKDWLAYVAFIRQAADGRLLLADPFTTEPQDGRFILLFHEALGLLCRWTGADPFLVLELSRVPLLFLFFWLLWRLTGAVLADPRAQLLACWLVGLSGGFEAAVDWALPWLPPQVQPFVHQDLWHLQGWNTFAASYNPLWVAALALTLVAIRPLLRPGGPRGTRDLLVLALGALALGLTHSYSLIVVVAVAVVRAALGWVFQLEKTFAGGARVALALGPPLAALAVLSRWQSADPVFRASSGNVFGPQALPVFWYPVTLGVVGFFALRGWRDWIAEGHPWRVGMAAWTLAVVFLHTSTVLNGYHFVFHLYVPVCLAAAPALARAWERARARPGGGVLVALVAILLFQSALTLTRKCVAEVAGHGLSTAGFAALDKLATQPPGNVLAPAELGNYIPAYTDHHVYVGQWFLTPAYREKAAKALAILTGRAPADAVALVDGQRIGYLVAPPGATGALTTALGGRVRETLPAGDLVVLVVTPAA